jgi:CRISPR-associated protein Cas2
MSVAIRRLLVAYDIAEDQRRDRVAVELQRHGERVQYSVFLVDGRPAEFVRLRQVLLVLIDPDADRVLFCDLGDRDQRARRATTFIGRQARLSGDEPFLIA